MSFSRSLQLPNLHVFYDGHCPLCQRAVRRYDALIPSGRIEWIDIRAPQFDAHAENLSPLAVEASIHVRDSHGHLWRGIEGLARIWSEIPGRRAWASLVLFPPIRPFARLGYTIVSQWVRPLISRSHCSGVCNPPPMR